MTIPTAAQPLTNEREARCPEHPHYTSVTACLRCGRTMCVDCAAPLDPSRCRTCDDEAPRPAPPIGGWLYIPLLSLYAAPLLFLLSIVSIGVDVASVGVEAALANRAWLALSALDVLTTLVIACFSLFILPRFRSRKAVVPGLMQRLYGLKLGLLVLFMIAASSLGQLGSAEVADLGSGIGSPLIFNVLWLVYFQKSERVRSTFVNQE